MLDQVGEFGVATSGGVWVAAGGSGRFPTRWRGPRPRRPECDSAIYAPMTRSPLAFAAMANAASCVAIDRSFPACSFHSNAVAR